MSSKPDVSLDHPRAFVYVSAEDIFRPWIPGRYIESKREAELGIERMVANELAYRGVYIRPSAYHISLATIDPSLIHFVHLQASYTTLTSVH